MSLTNTVVLGLIAGATILVGLPIGRLRNPAPSLRLLLNATTVGVLLFLVWDVLTAAWEPVDSALGSLHDGHGGLGAALGYGGLFVAGLSVGLLSLVGYERVMRRASVRPEAGRATARFGPGAMAADEPVAGQRRASWSGAQRLALLIAVGIGLHNLAEGLAIGRSAAVGQIGLATTLVIGFALHNATEGFGIVAPLAGDVDGSGQARRPGWGFLLAMGLIGGGPTFAGTVVGHSITSEPVAAGFLTLAAGSILYVIIQLLDIAARARRRDLLACGVLLGLVAGFLTDAVVSAAGV